MSEILVTTIRHESATTDTLTLGADGSLTINGNASLNGSAVVTEATGVTTVNGQTGAVTISAEPPTGYAEVGTYIVALIPTNSPIDAHTTVSASSLYTSIWTGSPGGFASNSYVAMNSYQDTAGPNSNIQSLGLSGTWRTLTNIGNGGVTGRYIKTLVVRVS